MLLKRKKIGQFTCELTKDMEVFYGLKNVYLMRQGQILNVYSGNTFIGRIALVRGKMIGFNNLPIGIETKYKGVAINEDKFEDSNTDKKDSNVLDMAEKTDEQLRLITNRKKSMTIPEYNGDPINIHDTINKSPLILHSSYESVGLTFYKSDLLIDLTERFGGNFEIVKSVKGGYHIYNSDIVYPTLTNDGALIIFSHVSTKAIGKCEFELIVKDSTITDIKWYLPVKTDYPEMIEFLLPYVGCNIVMKEEINDKIIKLYQIGGEETDIIKQFGSELLDDFNKKFERNYKMFSDNENILSLYDSDRVYIIGRSNGTTSMKLINQKDDNSFNPTDIFIFNITKGVTSKLRKIWENTGNDIYEIMRMYLEEYIGYKVVVQSNDKITLKLLSIDDKIKYYDSNILTKLNETFKGDFKISATTIENLYYIYDSKCVSHVMMNGYPGFVIENLLHRHPIAIRVEDNKVKGLEYTSIECLRSEEFVEMYESLNNMVGLPVEMIDDVECFELIKVATYIEKIHYYKCDILDEINKYTNYQFNMISFGDSEDIILYNESVVKPIVHDDTMYFCFTSCHDIFTTNSSNQINITIVNGVVTAIKSPGDRNLYDMLYHTIIRTLIDSMLNKKIKIK